MLEAALLLHKLFEQYTGKRSETVERKMVTNYSPEVFQIYAEKAIGREICGYLVKGCKDFNDVT